MPQRAHLAGFTCLLVCVGAAEAAPAGQDLDRATSPSTVEAVRPAPVAPANGFKWAVSFDAGWGTFGFANTLFEQPREGGEDDVRDRWFEGYIKPGLSVGYNFAGAGRIWSKVSAVGERTYGELPRELGLAVSSFEVEDLAVGWRSGTALDGLKEDALQFTVGRAPYTIGNGYLVWDGAAEGGSRGGYWTNGRKAWKMAAIGRFSPNAHTFEGFYLEKNDLPEEAARSRLWGVNYEWAPADSTTLGASYLRCGADATALPGRDGLNVLNVRAFTSPLPKTPDLAFEFEYAREESRDLLRSNAWTLKTAYQLSAVPWSPTLSYRYAYFQGDDPGSARSEAFDPLFLGFSDWGSWWQGEIAGEYFVSNSNLVSHQVRLHLEPSESLGTGLIAYRFLLDRPEALGPDVTSRDVAFELDWYVDWKIRGFTISAIAAFADPGAAVFQLSNRTSNLAYGMLYVGYSF